MRRALLLALGIATATTTGRVPDGLWAADPAALAVGELARYESMEMCVLPARAQRQMRVESRRQAAANGSRAPVRNIRDAYPAFASVAVDMERNEVVMTDENLFQILVYDRTEHTAPTAEFSKPKRVIVGEDTNIEFQSGVFVDQQSGDIYAANNDTRDTLVIFKHGSTGNVKPVRQLETPHGTFGVVIDDRHQELFMTEQHDSAIVVYRKGATQEESPIRYLQGPRTGLQDPHGIAFDPNEDVLFVANYGSTHDVALTDKPKTGVNQSDNREGKKNWPLGREFAVPGSGTINPPSITIYRRTAEGDAAPLRKIHGSATRLNWPTGLAFDRTAGELFVANDASHQILVFDAKANGNAAPKRVLEGAATKLANPTSVFADTRNRELWVANFGGHSATVYDISAAGNTAPKRIIRNAPEGTPSLMIGNPGAVGYDPTREEILVPN
jgi:DNA-binding beta-propeller fold protein YncE